MPRNRLLPILPVVLALGWAVPSTAQDAGENAQTPPNIAPANADETLNFSAEHVDFDQSSNIFTARGDVMLDRQGWRLHADSVTWNRTSGQVVANGNVRLTGPDGDTAYGDSVELTDTLRDGVVENLLVVFNNEARLAANRGARQANGDMELIRAAYTPCAVEDPDGCPKSPSWQVRAARVYYDRARNRIRYDAARIELFGLPIIPLPLLSHPAIGVPGSGLLVPDIRIDRTNGVEFALPYYLRFSPRSDLTLTPHIYSDAAPMAEAELRGLTDRGAWRVQGYATYSRLVPVGSTVTPARDEFRGYLDTSGGFQFDPRWSLSFSGRLATDRTFLRRYDISRDDRLRNMVMVARNGGSSYLTIAGWAMQTLRVADPQGQQPIALPAIDFRQRMDDPLLGGQWLFQANSLSLLRTDGQDTQRMFASARWDLRRLTPLGQQVSFTVLGRGDIYHTSMVNATPVPTYRGTSGWQARAFGAAAVDIAWPFISRLDGGRQLLTPRIQLVASTPVDNVDIPNEDSRAFELEDGNIFALNRFPGYDRFEDTTRLTYGLEYRLEQRGFSIDTSLAQSYRLSGPRLLFVPGSGLNQRTSDIVGRTSVAWRDFVRLTHRFRLDKDNGAIRRNEIDATIGSRTTYAILGYLRLNRDIQQLGEDLPDREEVRVGGRIQVARYWSIFGSAVVDLTDRREDPSNMSDGFVPIRHRIGFTYEDDCLTIGLTWRRDYQDTGDARRGNSFLLRLAFRNLGV